MLQFVPANFRSVLDVGCGGGDFSLSLKKLNDCEVWGVEPNQTAYTVASNRLDRVLLGSIEEISVKLPYKYFDLVIFNDVLEHLIEPQTALVIAKRVLTENGALVVSLPNIRYFHTVVDLLFRKDWSYQEYGVLDRTHLRVFTKLSTLRMFEEAGFSVYAVKGINPTKSRFFKLCNLLSMHLIDDMKFLQFTFVLYKSE